MAVTTKPPAPPPAAPETAPAPGGRVVKVYRFPRPLSPNEFMALGPGDYGMGEGKLELVDGDVVEMPPEFGDHTDVADDLADALRGYVAGRGGDAFGRVRRGACFPFPARRGGTQTRCPDVALLDAAGLAGLGVGPGQRLPRSYLACVPLLVAEVQSEHDLDRPGDFQDKLWEYLNARVALVWVLNPNNDTLTVYDQAGGLAAPTVLRLASGDHLDGGTVLPGFRAPLTTLFRPLPG
jgi:Uma2 family endonuclease